MAVDLFGDPLPATPEDLVAEFIREVKARGRGCFNVYRARHAALSVPAHIGCLVRTAAERAGLVMLGTHRAQLPASRGRLCVVWQVGEGGTDAEPREVVR